MVAESPRNKPLLRKTDDRPTVGCLTVLTPENAEIVFKTAGFTTRLAAFVVDLLIQIVLGALLSGLAGAVLYVTGNALLGAGSILAAICVVLMFLVIFAYPTAFEMFWAGQTPGKRLLGIRTVTMDGAAVTLLGSVLRNLLRIADLGIIPLFGGLFFAGLPAFFCMVISRQSRRIGDFAAGTVVIVDRGATPYGASRTVLDVATVENYANAAHNIDVLTVNDYRLLRRFVERRKSMDTAVQAAVGEFLVRPLLDKMNADITVYYQIDFADLAEILELKYAEKNGLL